MIRKPIPFLLGSLTALASLSAQSQIAETTELMALANDRIALWIGDDALGFAGRELEGERTVKGAPFCANAVHETVQALMDGNRIVRKQSTRLCRDGEGRTRREVLREGAAPVIYLHDPVARESWVLDPEKKTARKLRSAAWMGGERRLERELEREVHRETHGALSERMRENAERWREWAGQVAERARERANLSEKQATEMRRKAETAAKPGEPAVVIENEVVVRVPGASEPERRREVRVLRMQDLPQLAPLPPMPAMPPMPPGAPMPPMAPMAPMAPFALPGAGFAFSFGLPRGEGVTSALPARDFEGVKAHGERTTWTIPAGKMGNEKPIVISREVWRSPELMLTVMSKDSDPRSGEVSYRLDNLKRGEPDAQLMKVPGDYEQPKRAPRTPAPPPVKS
ncbi:MAG: hypothetical protein J0L58_08500 [Burkholderiales bacterium]|nr:hypothetical protein [Burkholderiales bacterium]